MSVYTAAVRGAAKQARLTPHAHRTHTYTCVSFQNVPVERKEDIFPLV